MARAWARARKESSVGVGHTLRARDSCLKSARASLSYDHKTLFPEPGCHLQPLWPTRPSMESPTPRPSQEPSPSSWPESSPSCSRGTSSGPPTALAMEQPVLQAPKPGDTGMAGAQHGVYSPSAHSAMGHAGLKHQSQILAVGCGRMASPPVCECPILAAAGGLVTMADFLGLGLGESRAWLRGGFRT